MESNSEILERQLKNIEDICAVLDGNKADQTDKDELKMRCLELWGIPIINVITRESLYTKNRKGEVKKFYSIYDTAKISEEIDKYDKPLMVYI